MIDLCFPNYEFRTKNKHNKKYIFDEIRKKFILLTLEEWVRQNCVKYLINKKKVSKELINVEKKIKINNLTKRYDIAVFKPNGGIFLLVECKSPNITINQETFNQISIPVILQSILTMSLSVIDMSLIIPLGEISVSAVTIVTSIVIGTFALQQGIAQGILIRSVSASQSPYSACYLYYGIKVNFFLATIDC